MYACGVCRVYADVFSPYVLIMQPHACACAGVCVCVTGMGGEIREQGVSVSIRPISNQCQCGGGRGEEKKRIEEKKREERERERGREGEREREGK